LAKGFVHAQTKTLLPSHFKFSVAGSHAAPLLPPQFDGKTTSAASEVTITPSCGGALLFMRFLSL
jgi:hypothetical protein